VRVRQFGDLSAVDDSGKPTGCHGHQIKRRVITLA
jgi:hypothetical protein